MHKLVEKFHYHLIAERYMAANTVEAYLSDINQFIDFLHTKCGIQSFSDVTLQHVKDFLKFLRYDLRAHPRSASRKISALKTFAQYIHAHHQLPLFTKGVIFPKLSKHLPKYMTQEQIQAIIAQAHKDTSLLGLRNKVIICLLYACGMRVSELINLHMKHINFEEKYIQVLGKGSKERIIPIPVELIPLLHYYIETVHPKLVKSYKQSVFILFPILIHDKITPITRQAVFIIVKTLAQKAGLMHVVSPHVLRHSLATHLLKKGANLRILQMLLGHEKLNTVQVYTHMDVSHLRAVYDRYHPRA